ENPNFKGFKKKKIEPRLNELMWQMFGGIVTTGENAWAPSPGVLPSGVPMGDQHHHFPSNHTINHFHHKLLRIIT
ncbi:hypothetical protein J1N35_038744, partial [Gossypium stocksii]